MTRAQTEAIPTLAPPKRADARRNYEKLVAAAREAFTDAGSSASLEDIARRAEVGIGTLYRHFPTRAALVEAVYVGEVESLCRSADDLTDLPPWDALVGWLHRFVGYVATKQALSEELLTTIGRDAPVFRSCHTALYATGGPLLERAQEAGVVRSDTNITQLLQLVGGIAKITSYEPVQIEHILDVALDGLRYRPADEQR
jgi:AcrR family transcriptional regulator